jgi:hypothetical protein
MVMNEKNRVKEKFMKAVRAQLQDLELQGAPQNN